MINKEWQNRFIDMAHLVASWSKDPSTKVGAVIVDDKKRIVSVGYNGFPRGVEDSEHRYNERELKYKLVCHAERNALDNSPMNVEGCVMFVTLPPCNECSKSIIQRGIKTVYYAPLPEKLKNYDWDTDVYNWKHSNLMFAESGVYCYVVEKT
jgi:dCMP deaminase